MLHEGVEITMRGLKKQGKKQRAGNKETIVMARRRECSEMLVLKTTYILSTKRA